MINSKKDYQYYLLSDKEALGIKNSKWSQKLKEFFFPNHIWLFQKRLRLAIVHYGTIVINSNARIGKNCRIHACTNIGASGGKPEAPQIGDNIYIGPGAKIYGNIKIANNIAISANSVVNKTFDEDANLIARNPAINIKKIKMKKIIKHL